MTYLSRPDRRAETEPAEERAVVLDLLARTTSDYDDLNYATRAKCAWCGRLVRFHRVSELSLCDAAYDAEIQRRRTGPVRIADAAGRTA